MEEKKKLWGFETKQVVYAAIGAALYAVLAIATNMLQLPGAGNVSIRPAVAIPMFFGVAFGPIVGFITGFVGNILADLLSGYGFWLWWDLGNGLLGLIPGLIYPTIESFRASKSIWKAEIFVVLGAPSWNGFGISFRNVGIWRRYKHSNFRQLLASLYIRYHQWSDPRPSLDDRLRCDCGT